MALRGTFFDASEEESASSEISWPLRGRLPNEEGQMRGQMGEGKVERTLALIVLLGGLALALVLRIRHSASDEEEEWRKRG